MKLRKILLVLSFLALVLWTIGTPVMAGGDGEIDWVIEGIQAGRGPFAPDYVRDLIEDGKRTGVSPEKIAFLADYLRNGPRRIMIDPVRPYPR